MKIYAYAEHYRKSSIRGGLLAILLDVGQNRPYILSKSYFFDSFELLKGPFISIPCIEPVVDSNTSFLAPG